MARLSLTPIQPQRFMPGDMRFSDRNTFGDALESTLGNVARRRSADISADTAEFALDQRRGQADRDEALDEATRSAVTDAIPAENATPMQRIARGMASTPGGGAGAAKLIQGGEEKKERYKELAVRAAAGGNMVLYKTFGEMAGGFSLGPEAEKDVKALQIRGQAAQNAKQFYEKSDDPSQAAKYFAAFIRSGGDHEKAMAEAGPAKRKSTRSYSPVQTEDEEGKPTIGRFNHETGDVETTGVRGTAGRGRAGGGGRSVYQQKREAWLAVHPGDDKGALDYASGKRQPTALEIEKMARSAANAEAKRRDPNGFRPLPPDELEALVDQYRDTLRAKALPAPARETPGEFTPGDGVSSRPRFNSPDEVRAAIKAGTIKSGDQFDDADGNTRTVP